MLISLLFSLFFTFIMTLSVSKSVVFYARFLIDKKVAEIKINIISPPASEAEIEEFKSKSASMINDQIKKVIEIVFSSSFLVFFNFLAPDIARGVPSVFDHEGVSLIVTVTNFTGQFLPIVPLFFIFIAFFIYNEKLAFLNKLSESTQEQDLKIISLIDMLPENQKELKQLIENYLNAVSHKGRTLLSVEAECIIEKLTTCGAGSNVNKDAGSFSA